MQAETCCKSGQTTCELQGQRLVFWGKCGACLDQELAFMREHCNVDKVTNTGDGKLVVRTPVYERVTVGPCGDGQEPREALSFPRYAAHHPKHCLSAVASKIVGQDRDLLRRARALAQDGPTPVGGGHVAWGPRRRPFERKLDEGRFQVSATQAALEQMQRIGGATICLPCGFGKTTCFVWLMARLAVRTFVLVNTSTLREQVIANVKAMIPEARVEAFSLGGAGNPKSAKQQLARDEGGADVLVGTFQGVSLERIDASVFDTVGLLVVDEAHHVPADTFTRAVNKFRNACYTLGVTATPNRKDNMTDLLYWTLGPSAFQLTRDQIESTREYELRLHRLAAPRFINDDMGSLTRKERAVYTKRPLPYVNRFLAESDARNALIVENTRELVAEGRKVILLTSLRSHAQTLVRMLGEDVAFLFLGGTKFAPKAKPTSTEPGTTPCPKKRKRPEPKAPARPRAASRAFADIDHVARERDVIVSTFSNVGEGFDLPRLDACVLCLPVSDITQFVGRVMREHDEKVWPVVVVDYVDLSAHQIALGMASRRQRLYPSVLGKGLKIVLKTHN